MFNMNEAQFNSLAISAFRYSIGRMTYIVSDTVEILIANIDALTISTKQLMIKEIIEHARNGNLGMDMDKAQWTAFREILQESLEHPRKVRSNV